MKKKVLKFTALISLIVFALNIDILAENTDDSACPDGEGGPVITCGRYEGTCWELDRIGSIIYIHCRFSGYQKDHCIPD
ncbi:hypothetical protein [Parabacteroides sp.]|jgi:hypothetical protein|uniref:hypothetical protein n=1 Tax=Parabacteroides sp. TaxID=1869337 RepID=UPI00257E3DD4|nr:hypothetical protein [Parabacteroides sp.]